MTQWSYDLGTIPVLADTLHIETIGNATVAFVPDGPGLPFLLNAVEAEIVSAVRQGSTMGRALEQAARGSGETDAARLLDTAAGLYSRGHCHRNRGPQDRRSVG